MLGTITFTGIDDKTDPEWAVDLTRRYPKIEFGILVGSHTGTGEKHRFPSLRTIQQWKICKNHLRLSLHLCGRYARHVLNVTWHHTSFCELLYGFDRVQVNARQYDPEVIRSFVESTSVGIKQQVILQHRGHFDPVPICHHKMEYLFDVSGGRGKDSIDQWPRPSLYARCGYSGGVGPGNVQKAIRFVNRWPSLQWIDMESGVRTNDVFDPSKVEQVCELAFPK